MHSRDFCLPSLITSGLALRYLERGLKWLNLAALRNDLQMLSDQMNQIMVVKGDISWGLWWSKNYPQLYRRFFHNLSLWDKSLFLGTSGDMVYVAGFKAGHASFGVWLHHHISTVGQSGQTKHQLFIVPFAFSASFLATVGPPTCLEGEGG